MENTIFIQIASYRDPQLVPTLLDLIKRSRRPELLRIVVCWQHAPDETLAMFWQNGFSKWQCRAVGDWPIHFMACGDAQIELIEVPHLQSQGACWARNLIQQHYRGERYTLQLDSHHCFVDGWDDIVIEMLESLRPESPKPLLTAYLPPFCPNGDPAARELSPSIMTFDRFSTEGPIFFRSSRIDEAKHEHPIPARFYSAHFAFADGHFAQTVPHDPALFFHGEEISISTRAFTHGYDLYHPHRLIAWHEYQRPERPKIWTDHSQEVKERGDIAENWAERNSRSLERARALLGMNGNADSQIEFGIYGFGSTRTLAQYERYAGVSFAHRGVQQATLDHLPPARNALSAPAPELDEQWQASLIRSNDIRVCVHRNVIEQHALAKVDESDPPPPSSARVVMYDSKRMALHGESVCADTLSQYLSSGWLDFHVIFLSGLTCLPASYTLEFFDDAGDLLARID